MDEVVGEFLVESYEGLDRLDQAFIDLEEQPDDIETLTEVFRILHTIKGTCGFLGFGELERVAHRGESLLSLLRDSVLQINNEITNALLATVDAIRAILETIEETGREGHHDNDDLVRRLEQLAQRPEEGSAEAAAPEAGAEAATPAAESAPEATPEPAASSPAGDDVDAAGNVVFDDEPAPAAPAADADAPAPAAEAPKTPPPPKERIGDILVGNQDASRTDVEIAATEQGMGDKRRLGEILVDDGRTSKEAVEGAASKQRSAADSTIRVDVAVIDSLMNLVGELVLSRNQIMQLAANSDSSDFGPPAQRLNLITSELQEGVMKTRMQPIGNVWNKLPRVVRDLAQQFGKQIRLEMEGKDTELDRTILEAIKDPLTHMVRNTVDHGIESPAERQGKGKDPEGTLRLSATHEGGQVNIEISDDGAGIDADMMRQKAMEKGVITPDAASKMSDNEAVQLIFAPGFSTAKAVSNVSGRGVGMDVVRTNVERIGGSVDIKTKVGSGTTFKIKIPLTLAIIPAITVNCDGNRYAIPQLSLQELVRLDAGDVEHKLESVHGAPVYRLRGRLLPIVDLREQLGANPLDADGSRSINIVVLQADTKSFGLIVDSIEDTEEIVVKPLGKQVADIALYSGATIMGDGTVALILDVMGLATRSNVLTSAGGASEQAQADTEGNGLDDIDNRILLLGFGGADRAAVSLAEVERLEEFGPEQIEASEHQPVVLYRGEVMPLVDLGPMLGLGESALDGSSRVSVVVYSRNGVSVGVAVRKILDIVARPEVLRGPDGRMNRAIIDGHVIDVVPIGQMIASHVPPEPLTDTTTDDYLMGATT